MSLRKERRERALALFAEPEFLEDLLDHVSEGGVLIDFTRSLDIKYQQVLEWLQSTDDRKKGYELAIRARDSLLEDEVISGVRVAARSDIRKLVGDDGQSKGLEHLDDATASAIAHYAETVDPVTKRIHRTYKLVDKTRNLELLGRHRKMFTDKVEHTGKLSLEELVNRSMQPEEKAA